MKAFLRKWFYRLLRPLTREYQYEQPEAVHWRGWVDAPLIGCIAFRTLEGDLHFGNW